MTRRITPVVPLLAGLGFALSAPSAPGPGQAVSDEVRAELLGALTFTRLSVRFDEAPAREVFQALSRAVGAPVTARYINEKYDSGIDGEMPITLTAHDVDAQFLLEAILEQCADYEPCTWQLRNGYIEAGTKERLSAKPARDTRTYPIRDFMLEAPYFYTGFRDAGVDDFCDHPYNCAALTRPVPGAHDGYTAGGTPHGVARKGPEALAQEMIQAIVQIIEPGNWDYGQFTEDAAHTALGEERIDTRRARATESGRRKIARIRIVRDQLIITAPDFIHRQVNGYPAPKPPPPLTTDELLERSQAASTDRARIVVLGNRPHLAPPPAPPIPDRGRTAP